jgi:hypothetical protein
MNTITGASSSLEHAKNTDFNSCVSLGKLSNLSVAEHINFSAFSSVISHGAGNFVHTISVEIDLIMNIGYYTFSLLKHKTEVERIQGKNFPFNITFPA